MALTGNGRELECNTPEDRIEKLEKTLILLGVVLDKLLHTQHFNVEGMIRKKLNLSVEKEKMITVGGIEVPVGTTVGEWLEIANKEIYDILSKGQK